MKVENIHARTYPLAAPLGALLDLLGSVNDRPWPHESWPRMRLDQPSCVGASGGHSTIGYVAEWYLPGHLLSFRFTPPAGFDGTHRFEVLRAGSRQTPLRHSVTMQTRGPDTLMWWWIIRPLHDALLERDRQ